MNDWTVRFEDYNGDIYFAKALRKNLLVAFRRSPSCEYESKVVRVEEDYESVFKLMKTKIKALDGAYGLINFLAKFSSINDFGSAYARTIYGYIFEEMREAKY